MSLTRKEKAAWRRRLAGLPAERIEDEIARRDQDPDGPRVTIQFECHGQPGVVHEREIVGVFHLDDSGRDSERIYTNNLPGRKAIPEDASREGKALIACPRCPKNEQWTERD